MKGGENLKIDGRKLDMIMAAQCLTAEKLSMVTGVSQVSIARFRKGTQKPRPATIGRIAKALNVEIQEIIETGTAIPGEAN